MKGLMNMTEFLPVLTNTGGNQGGMNMTVLIIFYVAIFAALYFFLIRPSSKRK